VDEDVELDELEWDDVELPVDVPVRELLPEAVLVPLPD